MAKNTSAGAYVAAGGSTRNKKKQKDTKKEIEQRKARERLLKQQAELKRKQAKEKTEASQKYVAAGNAARSTRAKQTAKNSASAPRQGWIKDSSGNITTQAQKTKTRDTSAGAYVAAGSGPITTPRLTVPDVTKITQHAPGTVESTAPFSRLTPEEKLAAGWAGGGGKTWEPDMTLPSAPGSYLPGAAPDQTKALADMAGEIASNQKTGERTKDKTAKRGWIKGADGKIIYQPQRPKEQNTGADAYAGTGFAKTGAAPSSEGDTLPYQDELGAYITAPHTQEDTRRYASLANGEEMERIAGQFGKWTDGLAAYMPQSREEYDRAVANGKEQNILRSDIYEGYTFDEDLLQMIDYLYGSGNTDMAEQGKNLAARLYTMDKDAENWNQYVSERANIRASEFYQKKADEIKNDAGGYLFLGEEGKKEVRRLEELAQQYKDAQYYYENDARMEQVAADAQALKAENPGRFQALLEAGRESEAFQTLKDTLYQVDAQAVMEIDQEIASLHDRIGMGSAGDINFLNSAKAAELYAEIERLQQEREALYEGKSYYALLTPEQEQELAYAAATMGEEEFEHYYDYLKRKLDGEAMEINLADNYKALGGDDPSGGQKVLAGIYSAVTSFGKIGGYLENARQVVHNALNPEDYQPVNMAAPAFMPTRYSRQGRDVAVKDLPPAQAFLADVGISTLEMVMALPLGAIGAPALLGANAAGDATLTALESGASAEEALAYSTIVGGADMVMEKFGIDGLLDGADLFRSMVKNAAGTGTKEIGKGTAKEIVQDFLRIGLKQGAREGLSEMGSEVADILAEMVVLKDKSSVEQYLRRYREEKPEGNEALAQAGYVLGRMGQAGLGGFLSGFGLSMAGNLPSLRKSLISLKEGDSGAVIERGLKSAEGSESRRIAEELYGRQEKGEEPRGRELGKLMESILRETEQRADEMVSRATGIGIEELGRRRVDRAGRDVMIGTTGEGGTGYGEGTQGKGTEPFGGKTVLYDGGRWKHGESAGEQNWPVAGAAGADQAWRSRRQRGGSESNIGEYGLRSIEMHGRGNSGRGALDGGMVPGTGGRIQAERRAVYEAFRGTETKRREIGGKIFYEVTAKNLPLELRDITAQNFGRGIRTVFVLDDIWFSVKVDGENIAACARGFADNGTVYIKINNHYTVEQINGHETFHVEVERHPKEYMALLEEIEHIIPIDVIKAVAKKYEKRYRHIYDSDYIAELAKEELLADMVGKMNPLGNIPEVKKAVERFYDKLYGRGAGEELRHGIEWSTRYSVKEGAEEGAFLMGKTRAEMEELFGAEYGGLSAEEKEVRNAATAAGLTGIIPEELRETLGLSEDDGEARRELMRMRRKGQEGARLAVQDTGETERRDGITFDNAFDNDIISGALNPYSSRGYKHAQQYYEAVRKMNTDVRNIAKNTGFSRSDIQKVKNYIFVDLHDLAGTIKRFDPSYDMAQSWQRLIDGKKIHEQDIILLKHELYEIALVEQGIPQDEAHIRASRKYLYKGYNK